MSSTNQNPSYGTKVTDPNAPTIQEGSGPIASDSLAAESSNAGGAFRENRDSEPLGVSGSNSTLANEDTSAARRIDPVPAAKDRPDSPVSYPDAAGGQAKGLAVTNTEGSYETGGATSSAGTAPSYVNSQYIVDEKGPKGKNLSEGGFDSDDSKNASFNSDIGGKDDPGRLAENTFSQQNAGFSNSAGVPLQKGDVGDNTYDALGSDTSA